MTRATAGGDTPERGLGDHDRDVIHVNERVYRVERATRADVPAVVDLLTDDEIARDREVGDLAVYETAYEAISRDRSQSLVVIRDDRGSIVGTMQVSILPGLARGGATRMQIEAVRIARGARSGGLGSMMLEWAHDYGRSRGATLSQLTTDSARTRALQFYESHGYVASHVGLKRRL